MEFEFRKQSLILNDGGTLWNANPYITFTF